MIRAELGVTEWSWVRQGDSYCCWPVSSVTVYQVCTCPWRLKARLLNWARGVAGILWVCLKAGRSGNAVYRRNRQDRV